MFLLQGVVAKEINGFEKGITLYAVK